MFADGCAWAVLWRRAADGFISQSSLRLPAELSALAKFLRGTGLREVELHHLLGHQPAILELITLLGVPYDVHVHDYALICPRIALVGRERRYCGEPAVADLRGLHRRSWQCLRRGDQRRRTAATLRPIACRSAPHPGAVRGCGRAVCVDIFLRLTSGEYRTATTRALPPRQSRAGLGHAGRCADLRRRRDRRREGV